MPFHVSCQISCPRGCKVTLIAFVWFFPTVCIQMFLQMARPRGCIVTLIAFIWLNDNFICFLETKIIIFKNLFHCHGLLWFAQMIASNWVKFMIYPWSCDYHIIAYFHFFIMSIICLGRQCPKTSQNWGQKKSPKGTADIHPGSRWIRPN